MKNNILIQFSLLFTLLWGNLDAQTLCNGKTVWQSDAVSPPDVAADCASSNDVLAQTWVINNVSSCNITGSYYKLEEVYKNDVLVPSSQYTYTYCLNSSGTINPANRHDISPITPWQTGINIPIFFKFSPNQSGLYRLHFRRFGSDNTPIPYLPRGGLTCDVYVCTENPPQLNLTSCMTVTTLNTNTLFMGGFFNLTYQLSKPAGKNFTVQELVVLLNGNEIDRRYNLDFRTQSSITFTKSNIPITVSAPGTYNITIKYKSGNQMIDVTPLSCPYPKSVVIEAPDLPLGATKPALIIPGDDNEQRIRRITDANPKFLWRNLQNAVTVNLIYQKQNTDGQWEADVSTNIPRNVAQGNYGNTHQFGANVLAYDTKYRWWIKNIDVTNYSSDSDTFYFATGSQYASECAAVDAPRVSDLPLYNAVNYLCGLDIVNPKPNPNGDGNIVNARENIVRLDLAAIVTKGLFGGSANVPTPLNTDFYRTPFADIENEYKNEYRSIVFLLYLEYLDGVAPFAKDNTNFRPYDPILRKHALKVFLEAFNIGVSDNANTSTYDINRADAMYKYVAKAESMQLLTGFSASTFNVNSPMTRREAFIILHRLMTLNNITRPTLTDLRDSENFAPNDAISGRTFARKPALIDGNFEHEETAVFNIPDIKTSLHFSFSYESSALQMPKDFVPQRPMGYGWSHSHHSYIKVYADWAANGRYKNRNYLLFFPGSHFPHAWEHTTSSNTSPIKAETKGIYYDLRRESDNVIIVTMLDKTVFRYEKLTYGDQTVLWLKSITDKNGNATTYTYQQIQSEDKSRLLEVVFPSSRKIRFLYESSIPSRITKVTGPPPVASDPPRSVTFAYLNDDLTTYTNLVGKNTLYFYREGEREKHLMYSIKLPKGNYITNNYKGRKLTATKTSSTQDGIPSTEVKVSESYNPNDGAMQKIVKDNNGNVLQIADYNSNGDVVDMQIKQSNGTLKQADIEYEDPNHPTLPTEIKYNGLVTKMVYNSKGQTEKKNITNTDGETLEHKWVYEDNFLIQYTNPRGHSMTTHYVGAQKNVDYITDFEGHQTRFWYEGTNGAKGLVTKIQTPIGLIYNIEYNYAGNVTKMFLPGNIFTETIYDDASRPSKIYDPAKITTPPSEREFTQMAYEEDDLIRKVIDQNNKETFYYYDDNRNPVEIKNANNKSTYLTYDYATDLLKKTKFGQDSTLYDQDDKGRLKSVKKPNDATPITIEYHINDMVKNDGYFKFFYNDKELLETVERANDASNKIVRTYDGFHRVSTIQVFFAGTTNFYKIRYEYDKNSNITKIYFSTPSVVEVLLATYEYDKNNRRIKAWDKSGGLYEMQRRVDGTPSILTYPNGMKKRYFYDDLNRVDRFGYYKSMNTSVENTLASYVHIFNDEGFIKKVTYREPLPLPVLPNVTETYTPNEVNRYTNINGATYNFDGNGNQRTTPQYGDITWNELDQATVIQNSTATFRLQNTYNVEGLRSVAIRNGVTTRYAHDLTGIGNVLVEMDGNGNPTAFYLHGFEEGMLSRIEANGRRRYFLHDVRGSTVAMTDENHNYTHKFAYTDYGFLADSWLATGEMPTRYTFNGAFGVEMDNENLYYMRARFYDATQMRFLSQDPVWDVNLYPFAGNNPIMNIDPTGLYSEKNWEDDAPHDYVKRFLCEYIDQHIAAKEKEIAIREKQLKPKSSSYQDHLNTLAFARYRLEELKREKNKCDNDNSPPTYNLTPWHIFEDKHIPVELRKKNRLAYWQEIKEGAVTVAKVGLVVVGVVVTVKIAAATAPITVPITLLSILIIPNSY